jgi:hypothetical protein
VTLLGDLSMLTLLKRARAYNCDLGELGAEQRPCATRRLTSPSNPSWRRGLARTDDTDHFAAGSRAGPPSTADSTARPRRGYRR